MLIQLGEGLELAPRDRRGGERADQLHAHRAVACTSRRRAAISGAWRVLEAIL